MHLRQRCGASPAVVLATLASLRLEPALFGSIAPIKCYQTTTRCSVRGGLSWRSLATGGSLARFHALGRLPLSNRYNVQWRSSSSFKLFSTQSTAAAPSSCQLLDGLSSISPCCRSTVAHGGKNSAHVVTDVVCILTVSLQAKPPRTLY